jgi:hypothetical protein
MAPLFIQRRFRNPKKKDLPRPGWKPSGVMTGNFGALRVETFHRIQWKPCSVMSGNFAA